MQGETKAKWMKLCEEAAVEQDSQRLIELVQQIVDLLDAKRRRMGIDTTLNALHSSSVDQERESLG